MLVELLACTYSVIDLWPIELLNGIQPSKRHSRGASACGCRVALTKRSSCWNRISARTKIGGLSGNANPIQKKHTSNLGPKKAHRTYLGRDQPPNISHRTFDLGLTLRTRTRTFNMGQRTQLPKLRAASLTDPNSVVPNDLIPSFSSYRTTAYSFAEGIKTFAHPSVQLVGLLTVRRVRGRG